MKKSVFLIAAASAAVLGLASLKAQTPAGPEQDLQLLVARLEARVNELQAQQQSSLREIDAKIERVLANQEKIIKELEIVKVRASLRP